MAPMFDLSQVDTDELIQELRSRGLRLSIWTLEDARGVIDSAEDLPELSEEQSDAMARTLLDIAWADNGMDEILAHRGNEHLDDVWSTRRDDIMAEALGVQPGP